MRNVSGGLRRDASVARSSLQRDEATYTDGTNGSKWATVDLNCNVMVRRKKGQLIPKLVTHRKVKGSLNRGHGLRQSTGRMSAANDLIPVAVQRHPDGFPAEDGHGAGETLGQVFVVGRGHDRQEDEKDEDKDKSHHRSPAPLCVGKRTVLY